MTNAQEQLLSRIKDMDRFASHNVGHITGTTTGFEKLIIQASRDAQLLRAALDSGKGLPTRLDAFEASFKIMAATSSASLHSTRVANVSNEEVDEILDKIDAVRAEMEG